MQLQKIYGTCDIIGCANHNSIKNKKNILPQLSKRIKK